MSSFHLAAGTRVRINGEARPGRSTGTISRVDQDDPVLPYLVSWDEGSEEWHSRSDLVVTGRLPDAIEVPAFGMTSAELADHMQQTVEAVAGRIVGVGHDQYATDGGQLFERMDRAELVRWAMEEAEDLIAYGVMLRIRLARVRDALAAAELPNG